MKNKPLGEHIIPTSTQSTEIRPVEMQAHRHRNMPLRPHRPHRADADIADVANELICVKQMDPSCFGEEFRHRLNSVRYRVPHFMLDADCNEFLRRFNQDCL